MHLRPLWQNIYTSLIIRFACRKALWMLLVCSTTLICYLWAPPIVNWVDSVVEVIVWCARGYGFIHLIFFLFSINNLLDTSIKLDKVLTYFFLISYLACGKFYHCLNLNNKKKVWFSTYCWLIVFPFLLVGLSGAYA